MHLMVGIELFQKKLTENMNFVARYTEVYKEYRVTFFDGNQMLFKTINVKHGHTVGTFAEKPSKLLTLQYTFKFSHWVIPRHTNSFRFRKRKLLLNRLY